MPKSVSDCPVLEYAEKVLNGEIIAGELVQLACQRHMDDLEKADDDGFPFYFDEDEAGHAIGFYNFLKHSKGEWAGKKFHLELWQKFIVGSIFGWKRKADHQRRFRTAYNEIPRKNGKSTLSSGVGLYLLVADAEPGAEIYSAATKRDQAKITFDEAANMVKASPDLFKRIRVYKNNLHVITTSSKFLPLGADADSLDGLNVHGAIVDEFHAHKNQELWDVLETATGARRQSLMFAITTAGFNQSGPCYALREYAVKVLKGTNAKKDETFFAFIATIDEGDDWKDPKVWVKANPNYGVSVKHDDLQRLAEKAIEMPTAQNNFLTKRLNVWTKSVTAWMPLHKWDASGGLIVPENLKNRRLFGGLDLSSKTDITAFVLLSEPEDPETGVYDILPFFWVPEENMREREDRDNVPYSAWVRQGLVFTTPGNVIDYAYIRQKINQLRDDKYIFQEIAFDPWNSLQLSLELDGDGFDMVEVRQGFKSMSEPTKQLETLVLQKRLNHGDNPVLRWMIENVAVRTDPNLNIMPDKKNSTGRIDGIVALIMGLSRMIIHEDTTSVYESRGVISL
jgi:phage terminase large subunit-like protein